MEYEIKQVIGMMRNLCRSGVEQFVVSDELYEKLRSETERLNSVFSPDSLSGPVTDLEFRGKKLLRRRDLEMAETA